VSRRLATRCLLATFGLIALGAPIAARTRPHYGGTLRVETTGDPWQRPNGIARRLVFDGLTTIAADGSIRPGLASEWESENANHRWQFHLRPGVRFHDGSPLTSIAAIASLNASCPANCPWTAVRATGSSVVFTGDSAMPNLPELLAGDEFLISLTISSDGKTPNGATGTGPFQVNGFSSGVLSLVPTIHAGRDGHSSTASKYMLAALSATNGSISRLAAPMSLRFPPKNYARPVSNIS